MSNGLCLTNWLTESTGHHQSAMLLRNRRRPRYGAQICTLIAALLLLLSVSLLYSRLNSSPIYPHNPLPHSDQNDAVSLNRLLDDTNDPDDHSSKDPIDQLDDAVLDTDPNSNNNPEDDEEDESDQTQNPKVSSMYFYDHLNGVVRRGYNKRSIEEWEDYVNFESKLGLELGFDNEKAKAAFGSDDIPVDERVRKKLVEVDKVEDALLLKGSALREGWGDWFDKKSDFLRRDRMFKSNLEGLNPLNNPILQDPDGPGLTGLTRGDRIVVKGLMNEFKKVPFLIKKPLAIPEPKRSDFDGKSSEFVSRSDGKREVDEGSTEVKRAERRTLHDDSDVGDRIYVRREVDGAKVVTNNGKIGEENVKNEFSGQVFANGKRWGYYPGLDERLSFSNFMDAFFRKGKCSMRVFMVWNSPPWMYGVRHQRGLESVLFHHPHACIVVFSETIELNFFSSFVNDGFKVAVVMPNLDELLKDTPAHIFASVWYKWKRTKFYPMHYSELIRLAALYKYGGIYLDSDIIVLKPLSLLDNNVGLEEEVTGYNLNGAVMAFRKHSPFVMECLMEFYSSYDDTLLRWNGADLLSRVASNFSSSDKLYDKSTQLKLLSSFVFFPIGRRDISRYFSVSTSEIQRAEQNDLFKKILKESVTFHFWNSLTSALVPDPESLVARILNHICIHCFDVL